MSDIDVRLILLRTGNTFYPAFRVHNDDTNSLLETLAPDIFPFSMYLTITNVIDIFYYPQISNIFKSFNKWYLTNIWPPEGLMSNTRIDAWKTTNNNNTNNSMYFLIIMTSDMFDYFSEFEYIFESVVSNTQCNLNCSRNKSYTEKRQECVK